MSEEKPLATVQAALSRLDKATSDHEYVIDLLPGVFRESLVIEDFRLAAGSRLIIRGDEAPPEFGQPNVQFTTANLESEPVVTIRRSNRISIEGIVFNKGVAGIMAEGSSVEIKDCRFHSQAVGVIAQGSEVRVSQSLFLANTQAGIWAAQGSFLVLSDVSVLNSRGSGLVIRDSEAFAFGNCKFNSHEEYGIRLEHWGRIVFRENYAGEICDNALGGIRTRSNGLALNYTRNRMSGNRQNLLTEDRWWGRDPYQYSSRILSANPPVVPIGKDCSDLLLFVEPIPEGHYLVR